MKDEAMSAKVLDKKGGLLVSRVPSGRHFLHGFDSDGSQSFRQRVPQRIKSVQDAERYLFPKEFLGHEHETLRQGDLFFRPATAAEVQELSALLEGASRPTRERICELVSGRKDFSPTGVRWRVTYGGSRRNTCWKDVMLLTDLPVSGHAFHLGLVIRYYSMSSGYLSEYLHEVYARHSVFHHQHGKLVLPGGGWYLVMPSMATRSRKRWLGVSHVD